MLGKPALLDAFHELPSVMLLERCRPVAAKVVHQIDVEIVNAEIGERFLQLFLQVLRLFAMNPGDTFVGDVIRVARMTLDERPTQRGFAVRVCPRRIEVVAARREIAVDHLRRVLDIDRIVFTPRETHAPKPQQADLARIEHSSPSPSWPFVQYSAMALGGKAVTS